MIDVCRGALCTWPSPTQPTLSTLCCSSNPVQPVTPGSGSACCLTRLDGRCSVSSTVSIVYVHLWSSPLLACYRKTVTLSSSNTTANVMFLQYIKIKNTSNTKHLQHMYLHSYLWNSIMLLTSMNEKLCCRKETVCYAWNSFGQMIPEDDIMPTLYVYLQPRWRNRTSKLSHSVK